MRVFLKNQRLELFPQDVLGSGGEGTVFEVKLGTMALAVKIYHRPSLKKGNKLVDLVRLGPNLPNEVVKPIDLVWDDRQEKIVGFTMRLLAPGQTAVETLFTRQSRQAGGITTKNVTELFAKLIFVLGNLHGKGIIIGDLNSLNIFYRKSELSLTDVDSFQFGPYPCEVATERYLSPRLYGVNLSLKPVFEQGDDWYSFYTLLFGSLLLVHPYGGSHQSLRTIPRRAQAKVMVTDRSVVYPTAAYPVEVVSDNLMQVFTDVFARGKIITPKVSLLEEYKELLIGCSSCGLWYPANRRACPGCKAANQRAKDVSALVRGVTVTELFSCQGPIIFLKIVDSTIYAVAVEYGMPVLYVKESLSRIKKIPLPNFPRDAGFDIFGKRLVVCPLPQSPRPELLIFNISGKDVELVTRTVSDCFGKESAVFAGTENYLYRLAGNVLLRGEIPLGHDLVDKVVATVTEKQTWFRAGAGADEDKAVGFYRVFEKHHWFLVKNRFCGEISLPSLENGERMTDQEIRFSSQTAVIFRKTKKGGKEFCLLDLVDIGTGRVISPRRIDVIENPHYENIHQVAYRKQTLLFATGNGLLAENAQSGTQKTFPQTARLITSHDYLWSYEDGVLVTTGSKALKIVLR